MINLVPPNGRKTIKYEYYLRVSGTIALLFSGVFIIFTVALFPMYLLLDAQIKAFEIEKNNTNKSDDIFQTADYQVKLAKEMTTQLKRTPHTVLPSAVMTEIRYVAPPEISFNNFIIKTTNGLLETAQVQGQAPTREALALLKNKLEESEMFDSVELPIADLARDENLPFAITITLAK